MKTLLFTILFLSSMQPVFADVLGDINKYRASNNLPKIVENKAICNLASIRILDVQRAWAHNLFYLRVDTKKGQYYENIARNFTNDNQIVPAWINSPSHKKVLLGYVTYGCVKKMNGYWVFNGFRPYFPD